MTGFIKPLRKIKPFSGKFEPSVQIAKGIIPDAPEIPDPVAAPTIDDAVRSRQDQDRLRRRRGVLANIYGGAGGGKPTVGTATLLGGG